MNAASSDGEAARARTDDAVGKRQSSQVFEGISPVVAVVRGLHVFLTTPSLWPKVVCPILISLGTTVICLALLFGFALRPQAEALVGCTWPAWVAWPSAVLLVLVEVSLINLIILLVLFGQVQSQIFRRVLEDRGVLAELRNRNGSVDLPEQRCIRDVGHSILFLLVRLPLLLITLPVNGVPVVGQVVWVFLNGWLYAWELEAEFLVMFQEQYSCGQQAQFVSEHFGAFSSFGAAAMGLELIPFLGPWVFFASNACGAALLAEHFYKTCAEVEQGDHMNVSPQAVAVGAGTQEAVQKLEV